jgi:hypothetical protein
VKVFSLVGVREVNQLPNFTQIRRQTVGPGYNYRIYDYQLLAANSKLQLGLEQAKILTKKRWQNHLQNLII